MASRFYFLEPEKGSYDTVFLEEEPNNRGDAPRCPVCGSLLGMLAWLPPYRAEIEVRGQRGPGDFASFNDLLVSERFAQAFRTEGLTGLVGFEPVEVVRVKPRSARDQVSKYLHAQAVMGRAAIDEAHSRIRHPEEVTCQECRSGGGVDSIFGFRLEPGTWDGLDVFRPRGLQTEIVASERFADVVKRHGFTNIRLTPTEQVIWDPLQKGPPPATALA